MYDMPVIQKKAPARSRVGASEGAVTYFSTFAVSSAWRGLTSLFGMGRGGAPALWPPWCFFSASAALCFARPAALCGWKKGVWKRNRDVNATNLACSVSAAAVQQVSVTASGAVGRVRRRTGLSWGACAPERVWVISIARL